MHQHTLLSGVSIGKLFAQLIPACSSQRLHQYENGQRDTCVIILIIAGPLQTTWSV